MSLPSLESLTRVLDSPAPDLSAEDAQAIAKTHFGFQATAERFPSERDQNFRLTTVDGECYLLRISNQAEECSVLEFENAALGYLEVNAPEVLVPRVVTATDGARIVSVFSGVGRELRARMFTWLDGVSARDVDLTPDLRRELGATLARLGLGLRGFTHPAAERPLLWDVQHASALVELTAHIRDPELRDRCARALDRIGKETLPRLSDLRNQVIHSDLNPDNVLISDTTESWVIGVIDFGDIVSAPLVCDIAIGAAYQLGPIDDPLAGAVEFVTGYNRVVPLLEEEVDVLFDLIATRLIATITISSWRSARYLQDPEHIEIYVSGVGRILEALARLSRGEGTERLRRALHD